MYVFPFLQAIYLSLFCLYTRQPLNTWERYESNYYPFSYRQIVGITRHLKLDLTTSFGEKKLWIEASKNHLSKTVCRILVEPRV